MKMENGNHIIRKIIGMARNHRILIIPSAHYKNIITELWNGIKLKLWNLIVIIFIFKWNASFGIL